MISPKRILFGAGLFVAAAVISLVVLSVAASRDRAGEGETLTIAEPRDEGQRESGQEPSLSASDFPSQFGTRVLPDPGLPSFRPRLSAWAAEQVGRYWIPVEDIAIEILSRQNDRLIADIFATVE